MSTQPSTASTAAPVHAIDGHTGVYFIVGHPVEQVQAPTSFNRIFALLGINAVLVPVQVAPADLQAFVQSAFAAPNVHGLWVTIPHKAPMLHALDSMSDIARMAGAVNGVRRRADGKLEGGLFDGEGFVASLGYFGIAYAAKRVLILGAGGAAAAIGASLALAGAQAPAEIAFFDPSTQRAAEAAARITAGSPVKAWAAASNDPAGFDVVINASPLGLKATDPLPCDVARMDAGAALVDILMKNQPTPIVRAARARGLVAEPGFEMMIQQTHCYLDFFGFTDAAQKIREDADFLRELIYPAELLGEIRKPA
ncbi:shikimate dehydrogenase [Rhodoferax sp.]|uniref:shikimate dehydrogenase family protein n=1 Tax=Rhodoferax sp. TaxID=50421 RepID=UPI0025E72E41|nr:shikimate dehydrogenase [Rhodoferax sp.]